MQHLIIYAHPHLHSFSKAMVDSIAASSKKCGCEVMIRDLYRMNFNPILSYEELQGSYQGIIAAEIRYEQQLISNADLITLVYPLWWMGFPAILKGYLDRVLTHGFAYKTENGISCGLLKGKKLQQFILIGSNLMEYQRRGFDKSIQDTLVDGLFNYCGIEDIQHQIFDDIHLVNDQARQTMLRQAAEITTQNLSAAEAY
ncbi:NAD(P)H-dependent oxidoreductase [Pasteurellaceae bacterium USgator11]|nr:NAD(P)H-dependent oxidoreductase [Pasteurellaceae bacterium UScroc12]TNG95847.1 NAD(P)H-dependent oxidoreductase [Pasteurellaceae bacterium USgator41]TNH00874.1 NAD(P)H-dependent oxidoreductase [Pasteurellaceae bacterium UScroc31]TNH02359.1 NAD(P)H-dependent oxidoreductase [Pasteurellaceae bacterium USgator11]